MVHACLAARIPLFLIVSDLVSLQKMREGKLHLVSPLTTYLVVRRFCLSSPHHHPTSLDEILGASRVASDPKRCAAACSDLCEAHRQIRRADRDNTVAHLTLYW